MLKHKVLFINNYWVVINLSLTQCHTFIYEYEYPYSICCQPPKKVMMLKIDHLDIGISSYISVREF